jgi:hypothetical protein
MRRATFFLLVFLCGSWVSSFGQHRPTYAPQVVATFQRLNQTTEIKPITLYTPPTWGMFRASVVMVLTEANGNQGPFWAGRFRFTDAIGSDPFFPETALGVVEPNSVFAEAPFRAKAGTPIKFSVTSQSGDTSNTKYNVFVVLEQLM